MPGTDPFLAFLNCCRVLRLETREFVRIERHETALVFDSGASCRFCRGTGRFTVEDKDTVELCLVCGGAGRV